jgi:membrane fusion protein
MALNDTTPDDEKDDCPPFLDIDPPHWAVSGLARLLILLFIVAAIASFIIKVPESVSAPFVLAPARGTDPVKTARGGVIRQAFAFEGQLVKQGEPLFVIQSELAGDRAADLQSLETQLAGSSASLNNARAQYESHRLSDLEETRKLEERVAHLGRLIAARKNDLETIKQIAGSYAKLYKDGLASQNESKRRELEVSQAASEIDRLEAEQRETRAAIEKLRYEATARQTELRELERRVKEEATRTEIRVAALRNGLANSRGAEVTVTAPHSGIILGARVKGSGAVVSEGEVLCEMVREGEMLQAELAVPATGVGRLCAGQGVKLLYDAFPYQRYGVRYGVVRWISPASLDSKESPTFRALVDLETESLVVAGQPRALLPGMSGRAEVVIGRRSLISFVFEPIRQLKESFADAPAGAITPKGQPNDAP